jgi:phosphoadenosine phosphosulfate reductase
MRDKLRQTQQLLGRIAAGFAPAALASSLGAEDMVLLDLIDRDAFEIGVFTLDTGRLPEETYDLLQRVRQRYRTPVIVYFPDSADVEGYVAAYGPNGFYDGTALREECCRLRKLEPLQRALAGKLAWITGRRRGQSATRGTLPLDEWDADNLMIKFNPLANWSDEEIWAYIREHDVPHSALHAKGFPSIGCAPCTRAINPGEDFRAGRWWWENSDHKECGLHTRQRVHG